MCVSFPCDPTLQQWPNQRSVWGTIWCQEQADLLHLPEGVQKPACPERPHAVPRGNEGLPQPQTGQQEPAPSFAGHVLLALLCRCQRETGDVWLLWAPGEVWSSLRVSQTTQPPLPWLYRQVSKERFLKRTSFPREGHKRNYVSENYINMWMQCIWICKCKEYYLKHSRP